MTARLQREKSRLSASAASQQRRARSLETRQEPREANWISEVIIVLIVAEGGQYSSGKENLFKVIA